MVTSSYDTIVVLGSAQRIWVDDYMKEGLPVYWNGNFASPTLVKHEGEGTRWAFAAERVGFLIDAEAALATACDRRQQPVRGLVSGDDIERLQKLLDDWAMSLRINEFLVDEDRVVVFDRTLMGTEVVP